MKTNWDYSELADAYLKRPGYSENAINQMLVYTQLKPGAKVCDVGAGAAHLTLMLLERGFDVVAVEPNATMRASGIERTKGLEHIVWVDGAGEETKQPASHFDMVTFGSSFNVTDRIKSLQETARILKPRGWFACLWNHRDINNPIQKKIENIIKKNIPNYDYGTRREDQTNIINETRLFGEVKKIEAHIIHQQTLTECLEAWRSHATLKRQAGDNFVLIIDEIGSYLNTLNRQAIDVPYTTRIWVSRVRG